MARVTFNGAPGETHTNESSKVQYQLIVSWRNSCGVCCQFDRAVGPSWPIPFHRNCRCKQVAIYPGKESQPFVDFRAKIAGLAHAEQSRVVGRSNLTLVESGLVDWGDVVTAGRIKDFRQVVAERKLTVKQMVKAGVNPRLARAAHEGVHTPAHRQAASRQAELVAKLRALGVEREALTRAVAERLAARLGIGSGPSGPQSSGITPTTPVTPGGGAAARRGAGAGTRRMTAAERADYLEKSGVKAEAARLKAEAEAHARRLAELEAKRKAEAEAAARAKARAATGPAELTRQQVLDRIASASSDRPSLQNAAIYDFLAPLVRSTPTRPGAYHGMTDPEPFHTIRYEGINYHFTFPAEGAPRPGPTGLPAIVYQLRGLTSSPPIPRAIARHTTDVYLSSQANKDDGYWQERYNNPKHRSLATGGESEIVAYHGGAVTGESLVHEMGHNLADATYGSTTPRAGSPFDRAINSGERPWTDYARNSPAEDFAESVREYWRQPAIMKRERPLRYQAIDELVRQSGDEAAP